MGTEYRLDELARRAGVASTTVRLYQAKGLLAPPRLEGRTGWYDDAHLSRLRLIARLQGEGYSLAGIADLLDQWERGRSLDAVIGVEAELDALLGDVHAIVVEPQELVGPLAHGRADARARWSGPAALGLVELTDDGRIRIGDRRFLEAGAALGAARRPPGGDRSTSGRRWPPTPTRSPSGSSPCSSSGSRPRTGSAASTPTRPATSPPPWPGSRPRPAQSSPPPSTPASPASGGSAWGS